MCDYPVLLLNLDRRSDRLETFQNQILNSKIIQKGYSRYSAIDGSSLSDIVLKSIVTDFAYDGIINNKKTKGLYMSRGGAGLALTYKNIFEVCNKITILLEDDILIDTDFDTKLVSAIKELPQDWDILYLGWHKSKRVVFKEITENLNEVSGQVNGTYAWVINKQSAKKLLNLYPLNYQIDTCIYLDKNLKKYCLKESIVHKLISKSDIQN